MKYLKYVIIDREIWSNKKDILSRIIKLNRNAIVDGMKTVYQYLMDDICTLLAEVYFDINIYQYNDVVERRIENDDLTINVNFYEVCEMDYDKEAMEDLTKKMRAVTQRVQSLDETTYDMLIDKLITTYYSYHNGMYITWDGDNVESEFTMVVHIEEDDVDSLLSFLDIEAPPLLDV